MPRSQERREFEGASQLFIALYQIILKYEGWQEYPLFHYFSRFLSVMDLGKAWGGGSSWWFLMQLWWYGGWSSSIWKKSLHIYLYLVSKIFHEMSSYEQLGLPYCQGASEQWDWLMQSQSSWARFWLMTYTTAFYDLTSEVTQCHFHKVPLVRAHAD